MSATPTTELARFIAQLQYEDLPAAIRERVKDIILDTLASAIAGRQGHESPQVRALARALGGSGEASVIGGERLSLAGAQKKLPIFYDEQNFHLGYGTAASNYIIKPAVENLDATVENEAFCMALAREVGLEVPRSFVHQHGDTRVFVVKRFDRTLTSGGTKRLHQEDFCQALHIPPEYKYESEGGPSLAACFNLVRQRSIRSGKDVLSLLNWVIFNYLIGNSDAHGKNISLLLLPEGPMLAPFYDLLSTRIYAHYGLAEGLAMKIGGEADPRAIQKKHWEQFAEEVGIKPRLVLTRALDMARKIQAARLQLFKGAFAPYKCDALYRLMELMGEQAEKAIRKLA